MKGVLPKHLYWDYGVYLSFFEETVKSRGGDYEFLLIKSRKKLA